MVVGVNHRTAPLAMRERFWIGESRRYQALRQLSTAEGIEEILVLSTCCRTEFLLWASDPTLAANSLVHYLSTEHSLKLSEWEHFYRRLDDAALTHIFRLTCGLDSQPLCESEIGPRLQAAWEQARTVGAAGPFLSTVLQKAFQIADRVREEFGAARPSVTISTAVLALAQKIFGSIAGRNVLLLGTSTSSELSAQRMLENGAASVVIIDEIPARARTLAEKLGCTAVTPAERWSNLLRADIVISATDCPHFILTSEEAERIAAERNRVALLIVDIAMPRDIDPEVRRVDGILLYDLDGLDRMVLSERELASSRAASLRQVAAARIEKIVSVEAQTFRDHWHVEAVVPTAMGLRRRLEQICRQELESFITERGPFPREQVQLLHAVTNQVLQKIASSLARELKELPEKAEQERMAAAVTRLFHLDAPPEALAGTSLEKEKNESRKQHVIAINF
jgi:glutamyl-tRNA reductase